MESINPELLSLAIDRGLPFLLSGPNGAIYSANQAFCELVGYSEVELKKIGWIKLSVDNEELHADQQLAEQLMAGKIQDYQQWKAYRSRYGPSIPGQLLAIRFPQGQEKVEFCLCWFTPLVNGSTAALDVVTKYIQHNSEVTKENLKAIETMLNLIGNKPDQTKLRAMVEAIVDWGFENPGKAGTILMAVASAYSVLPQMVMRLTLPPQPVQIQVLDPKTGEIKPATQQLLNSIQSTKEERHGIKSLPSNPISHPISAKIVTITTPGGARIETVAALRDGSWHRVPVSGLLGTGDSSRWSSSGRGQRLDAIGTGCDDFAGTSDRSDELPNAAKQF